jgi:hypothetical protein
MNLARRLPKVGHKFSHLIDMCAARETKAESDLRRFRTFSVDLQGLLSLERSSRPFTSEGFTALWHGSVCDWIRIAPQFMLRYLISIQLQKNPILKTSALVADNISAVISMAAVHPIDVVHSLMQSDSIKHPSISSARASLLKTDRISGLYRGLVPTILGYIPYRAVQ